MGIKQIAKLANVSIGTVDRVIHKRPGVSKETEKKILKIIEEVGYTKNTTASRLKLASIKKIKFAVLLPRTKDQWNYWKLPKEGITKAVNELKELGVLVDYFDFLDSNTYNQKAGEIFKSEYDAVITVAFFKKESNAILLKSSNKNLPIVFLDTEISLKNKAFFIRQNSEQAGKVAGRLLYGLLGNSGEYLIINKRNDQGIHINNLQREAGFIGYLNNTDFKENVKSEAFFLDENFELSNDLLNWLKTPKPKGLFVTNSKSHIVINALKKHRIDNVFIVGFDLNQENIAYLKSDHINFLIDQKPELQGYLAVKNLFNHIAKQDGSDLNYNIPIEIIVKENLTTS